MPRAPYRALVAGGRRLEVADIFRRFGESYRREHRLSRDQSRAMWAIEACRTAVLGGHRESCGRCGFERITYNSCRNRHCPKCQSLVRARWLDARKGELLPVPYFHVVFTLPHELNTLVLFNQRELLSLLFASAAQTLLEFGERHLGGRIGATMVLHTWDQTLGPHFHVHCIVPGGALAADGSAWKRSRSTFLFLVRALSCVFRAKFLMGLRHHLRDGRLRLPDTMTGAGPARMIENLWNKKWVVYAKRPFGGPEAVLEYLSRYTHRVAISNERLLAVSDSSVSFRYRDRRHGDVVRTQSLVSEEFIRRFLLHVLPKGFMRIRHFGLLANRVKSQSLQCAHRLLASDRPEPASSSRTAVEWMLILTGTDIARCPRCGATPLARVELPAGITVVRTRAPPLLASS